jgi:hypothetical protein
VRGRKEERRREGVRRKAGAGKEWREGKGKKGKKGRKGRKERREQGGTRDVKSILLGMRTKRFGPNLSDNFPE